MIKPGLIDAVRDTAEAFARALQPLRDALLGVEIRRSAHIPRGETRRLEPEDTGHRRAILMMHPLDAVEAEHGDEPSVWLDESAAWIVERAHRELDNVAVNAKYRCDLGAIRQLERLAEFDAVHGLGVSPRIVCDQQIIDGSVITVRGPRGDE